MGISSILAPSNAIPASKNTRTYVPTLFFPCQSLYMYQSILQPNPKLLIQLPNSHTPILSNHPNQALSHVPDIVILVKKMDMCFHCFGSWIPIWRILLVQIIYLRSRGRGGVAYFNSFLTASSFSLIREISNSRFELRDCIEACSNVNG